MADTPAPKKRGRPAMMPLAKGADKTFAPAAIVPATAPPAASITAKPPLPVVDLPTADLPVTITPAEAPAKPVAAKSAPVAPRKPVEAAQPAPVAPATIPPVMVPPAEPAGIAEPVAIAPVLAPVPVPPVEAVAQITEVVQPALSASKGLFKMATAFPTAAPVAETAEKAKAMFGDMNTRAKSAMEKSVKLGEEMTELTKGNVEALVQSGRVAAKGAEALAQDAAETIKKHFESATSTMKSFASVKSPTELFQLQSEAAKSYFDTAVADMSKFTEQMMKLAGDVAQPLSSRYSTAMEKVKAAAL